jgi:hypothetical protein
LAALVRSRGPWLWTDTERAEQAKEAAQAQVLQTAQALMAQGMSLEAVTALMQLSPGQVQQLL